MIITCVEEMGDTYVKDLETSNIQDTDEVLSFCLDIEGNIDSFDQPAEHTIVDLKRAMLTSVGRC